MKNEKELREVLLTLKELCGKIEAMLDEGYVYVAPDTKKYDEQVDPKASEDGALTDHQLKVKISKILKDFGVPASLLGYDYLRYAITLAYQDKENLRQTTKILYPSVASKFETTPSRVERAIRHAIEVALSRGSIDVLNSYFGFTIDINEDKPTNMEFIAAIADNMELEYKN